MQLMFQYGCVNVNAIDVYLLDIRDNLVFIDTYIIPNKQLVEINQYRNEKDRNKRLLARCFIYSLLKEKYGIDNYDLGCNDYKKPYLIHSPEIQFNFSYSNEAVLVGISENQAFGIDIEYIDTSIVFNDIIPVICTKEEAMYFNALNSIEAKRLFFYQLFTLKESLIKAMGMGLYFDVTRINCPSLLSGQDFTYKDDIYHSQLIAFDQDLYQFALSYQE